MVGRRSIERFPGARRIKNKTDGSAEAERLFDQGCELSARGDIAGAIAAFEKSVELSDTEALTYCNLGVSYEALGNTEAAVECYATAAKLGDPAARVNLGDALVRSSRYVEATQAYVEALKINLPEPWVVLNNLGVAYEHFDVVKAKACYKKSFELRPDYDLARRNYFRMVKKPPLEDTEVPLDIQHRRQLPCGCVCSERFLGFLNSG